MTNRAPLLGWLLALFIVGGFSWYASFDVSWTSVACARSGVAAGVCRITTASLSREEVHVVPLNEIGGTWLLSSSRAFQPGSQVWLGTQRMPIALSSASIPRHQAEYMQHRLREFVLASDARTLSFEEEIPWPVWWRCLLVLLMMLLLPIVWKLAIAIEDVRRLRPRSTRQAVGT